MLQNVPEDCNFFWAIKTLRWAIESSRSCLRHEDMNRRLCRSCWDTQIENSHLWMKKKSLKWLWRFRSMLHRYALIHRARRGSESLHVHVCTHTHIITSMHTLFPVHTHTSHCRYFVYRANVDMSLFWLHDTRYYLQHYTL